MRYSKTQKVIIALVCLLGLPLNTVCAKTSPLLNQLHKLRCAKDQSIAEKELEKLRNLSSSSLNLPREKRDSNAIDYLTAGSLDITLNTLTQTAKKYPELQNLVERTLLLWNYCKVFENGQFYDLASNQPRLLVTYSSPINWLGFRNLGFLKTPATFTPELLSHSPLGERAFEAFFHRIYRLQCFPHPTTGKLFHRPYRVDSKKIVNNKTAHSTDYPYQWNTTCEQKKPKVITLSKTELKSAKIKPIKKSKVVIKKKVIKAIKKSKVVVKKKIIKAIKKTQVKFPAPKLVAKVVVKKQQPIKTKRKKHKKARIKKIAVVSQRKKSVKAQPNKTVKKLVLSLPRKNKPTPITTPFPSKANNSSVSSTISEHPEKTHGFTGNIYIKQSLSNDHPTIGIVASYKPIADDYWFIRGSLDYDDPSKSPLTYSWGVGYDDWHEGTWSLQLNNWGPIHPKEGLAFSKSTLNFGHKFKSKTLAKYKLSANTSIDFPMAGGDPALNLGMQWSPKENWYIRSNIHQPLDGSNRIWSYGFGYSNWRTNKINVEYSNYGANELFDTNFRKSGVINISYTWEY